MPFRVEYFWQQDGKTFDRLAFFHQYLENIVSFTDTEWNAELNIVKFPTNFGIHIQFVSDQLGEGMMMKHILWALEEVFDIFVENNRYQTGTIMVDSNWWENRLAIGSIRVSTLSSVRIGNSTVPLSPVIELPNGHPVNTSDSIQASNQNQTGSLNAILPDQPRVSFQLEYRENGASIPDSQIYNTTAKMMIKNAENDRKEFPVWPQLSVYNDLADFTLSLRPISLKKRVFLTYRDAAFILCYLPMELAQYTELSGLVTIAGKSVGTLCVDKGDRRNWDASRLCQPPRLFETGSEAGGLATS